MMDSGGSILKQLEPDDELPEYLKKDIVSEIDTMRNSMVIVNHFTQHFFSSLTTFATLLEKDDR